MKRQPPERLRLKDAQAAYDFMSPDPQGVDTSTRRNVQHEEKEQEALWEWVQTQPWHSDFFHWPNERRSRSEAYKLKRQGVKKGPSDNWLFLPAGNYAGAISELKRQGVTRSALSEDQRHFLLMREFQGWAVGVHRGWEEASVFFQDYVAGNWSTDGEEWWR